MGGTPLQLSSLINQFASTQCILFTPAANLNVNNQTHCCLLAEIPECIGSMGFVVLCLEIECDKVPKHTTQHATSARSLALLGPHQSFSQYILADLL